MRIEGEVGPRLVRLLFGRIGHGVTFPVLLCQLMSGGRANGETVPYRYTEPQINPEHSSTKNQQDDLTT